MNTNRFLSYSFIKPIYAWAGNPFSAPEGNGRENQQILTFCFGIAATGLGARDLKAPFSGAGGNRLLGGDPRNARASPTSRSQGRRKNE